MEQLLLIVCSIQSDSWRANHSFTPSRFFSRHLGFSFLSRFYSNTLNESTILSSDIRPRRSWPNVPDGIAWEMPPTHRSKPPWNDVYAPVWVKSIGPGPSIVLIPSYSDKIFAPFQPPSSRPFKRFNTRTRRSKLSTASGRPHFAFPHVRILCEINLQ